MVQAISLRRSEINKLVKHAGLKLNNINCNFSCFVQFATAKSSPCVDRPTVFQCFEMFLQRHVYCLCFRPTCSKSWTKKKTLLITVMNTYHSENVYYLTTKDLLLGVIGRYKTFWAFRFRVIILSSLFFFK